MLKSDTRDSYLGRKRSHDWAEARAGLCELRGVKKNPWRKISIGGVHDRLKPSRVTKG
jgi:hypothetical protein